MGNCLGAYKIIHPPNDPAIPILGIYPREGKYTFTKTWPRMLIAALPPPQKKTQSKTKQKLEANTNVYQQDKRFLKKNLVYLYTGILLSNKTEWTNNKDNMDESLKHCTK